jgi:hypothetical protein
MVPLLKLLGLSSLLGTVVVWTRYNAGMGHKSDLVPVQMRTQFVPQTRAVVLVMAALVALVTRAVQVLAASQAHSMDRFPVRLSLEVGVDIPPDIAVDMVVGVCTLTLQYRLLSMGVSSVMVVMAFRLELKRLEVVDLVAAFWFQRHLLVERAGSVFVVAVARSQAQILYAKVDVVVVDGSLSTHKALWVNSHSSTALREAAQVSSSMLAVLLAQCTSKVRKVLSWLLTMLVLFRMLWPWLVLRGHWRSCKLMVVLESSLMFLSSSCQAVRPVIAPYVLPLTLLL